MIKNNIAFIGIGNMAKAIIHSMNETKINSNIFIYDIDENQYQDFIGENIFKQTNINLAIDNSEYILLSIKPQSVDKVIEQIKNNIKPNHIIISIVAGLSIQNIKSKLPTISNVVTVMPNTNLLSGHGSTAIAYTNNIPYKKLDYIKNLFSNSGFITEVPEQDINKVIPINGSGPAYIFLAAKAFLEYSNQQNLDFNTANQLFAHTLIGCAKTLLNLTDIYEIDDIIDKICSPNGTTIEGINYLKQNNFEQILIDACNKCVDKANILSKNNN